MKKIAILLGLSIFLISCGNYDERGFDLETRIHKKTENRFDLKGFDFEGYDKNGYDKYGYNRDGYNLKGFNRIGFHKLTNTKFDTYGYDKDGYNRNGFNARGYNSKGIDKYGFYEIGIHSITKKRFDKNGFNKNGIHKDSLTRYNYYGYDRDGFNVHGINKKGLFKATMSRFDIRGFDKDGFDKDGFDKDGFNIEGYNRDGFNKKGYDKKGFNREGYNFLGFNKDGVHKHVNELENLNGLNSTIILPLFRDEYKQPYIYLVKGEKILSIFIKLAVLNDDYLEISELIVNYDNQIARVKLNKDDIKYLLETSVSEVIEFDVTENVELLKKIYAAKDVNFQLVGKKEKRDLKLDINGKLSFKNVIDEYYKILNKGEKND